MSGYIQVNGLDFFNLLVSSDDFTKALGCLTLASGKLEAELILLLQRNHISMDDDRATLGKLIGLAKKNNILDKNLLTSLQIIKSLRNEFIHRIYSLLTGMTKHNLLPDSNLIDDDVSTYLMYANELTENLIGLCEIISKK